MHALCTATAQDEASTRGAGHAQPAAGEGATALAP